MAHAAESASDELTEAPGGAWTIDTFANVFVVPREDAALIRLLDATSDLRTSGGMVRARWALLQTPVGERRGLVAPESPRLMPGDALDSLAVDYLSGVVQASAGGRPLKCGMNNGHPVCYSSLSDRAPKVAKTRKTRPARTDHPQPPIYQAYDSITRAAEPALTGDAKSSAERPDDAEPEPRVVNDMRHACTHEPKRHNCEICMRAKLQFPGHRRVKESKKSDERAKIHGERLIGDLCTPWPTAPRGEQTLFCVLDEFSGLLGAFPLLGKLPGGVKESLMRFRNWMRMIRQVVGELHPSRVWFWKRDQGGEFEDLDIRDWIADQYGIEETVPTGRHVSQAERTVRTIAEGTRALLSGSGLPGTYWSFCSIMYFWNKNLSQPAWRAMCEKHSLPTEQRIPGQLCFTKLDRKVFDYDKADEAARPCAFLSWSLRARYGAFVLFINKEGKYATTMVDRRGIFFPDTVGMPAMAFERKFKDLKTLSVPSKELGESSEPLTDLAAEVARLEVNEAPGSGGHGREKPSWVRPNSKCPACRGRETRPHNYSGSDPETKCRFSGLDKQKVQTCRSLGTRIPAETRDTLIEAAGERLRNGATWPDTRTWIETQFEEVRNRARAGEQSANGAGQADAAQVPVREASAHAAVHPTRDFWSWQGDQLIRVHVEPRRHLFAPHTVRGAPDAGDLAPDRLTKVRFLAQGLSALERTDTWQGSEAQSDLGSEWVGETVFHMKCDSSSVAHMTAEKTSQPFEDTLLEDPVETASDLLTAHAHVTRNMTREEKASAAGQQALQKEIDKLILTYKCIGPPVSRDSVTDKKATLSGLVLLASIKNAEKASIHHKPKGRAVALGNRIVLVRGGGDPTAGDGEATDVAWATLRSELASLEEGRAVDAWSVLHGYALESVDFECGYLQCAWPPEWPMHYLVIPNELLHFLPESHRPKNIKNPIFPMYRTLYGHPASGHVFVNEVQDFLESKGWTVIGRAGSRTLMKRGETLLVLYVDDCKAAGPRDQLDQLWTELRSRFVFEPEQATTAFLGQQIHRVAGPWSLSEAGTVELRIEMQDYCDAIVNTFKDLWKVESVPDSSVPLASSLRAFQESDKKQPQRRVQKLVGMLLWLARSSRPDLGFPASAFGSRVNSWTAECDTELKRCIGYIAQTRGSCLRLKWRPGTPWETRLYTDSDWRAPVSQSGYVLCIEPKDQAPGQEGGLMLPLAWGSRRQPFTAESVAAAEVVACYVGLRDCLPAHWALLPNDPLNTLVDNSQVVSLARNGHSESLYFVHKATNVREGWLKAAGHFGWCRISKIRTEHNRSNLLTKPVKAATMALERSLAGLLD